LVLWAGLGVFRGGNQIFLAFEFRHLHEETKSPAVSSQWPVNEMTPRSKPGHAGRSARFSCDTYIETSNREVLRWFRSWLGCTITVVWRLP
jgi:hypothetical protein